VAVAGGGLAWLLHVPLPWMIGSMLAVAALAWTNEVRVAGFVRPVALLFLGLGLGQTFSGPVLAAVAAALPTLVLAGVLTIATGLVVARLFVRLAGTDGRDAYYAAVPGGVIVMAVLAQRAGASVPTVTLAQTIRMVLVVLLFPPVLTWLAPHTIDAVFQVPRPPVWWPGLLGLMLAGGVLAYAAQRADIANPWMIGPCLMMVAFAAFEAVPSGVPLPLVDAAQVAMGAGLGQRLTRRFLLGSRRLALASLVSALALCALLAALAFPVAWLSGLPTAAVVLGMAPGGMPEMTVTAKALELAVPLVLGFHLTRQVLCNLLIGPMWRAAVALGLAR
jgi:hypothetical protein